MPGSCNHYQIQVYIDPKRHYLKAQGNLLLQNTRNSSSTFPFFLHNQLELKDISAKGLQQYTFDKHADCPYPYIPQGGDIRLAFSEQAAHQDTIAIHFAYEGRITTWPEWSANVISEDWTELGLYFPWFPYNPEYGLMTFSVSVECDGAYQVSGYGDCGEVGGVWQIEQCQPVNDIVIVLAKEFKSESVEAGGFKVDVNYLTLEQTTARLICEDIASILVQYSNWFGGGRCNCLSLIQSMREKGGGYTRPGLIVLGDLHDSQYLQKREAYIRYMAHETAHLWWWQANPATWEDWLNESFAEFSAMMIIEELFGQKAYDARLEEKREASLHAPPIWGLDRSDSSSQEILYKKGPVNLHRLRSKLGREGFCSLCRRMVSASVTTTDEFLGLLLQESGKEIRDWFKTLLMEGP